MIIVFCVFWVLFHIFLIIDNLLLITFTLELLQLHTDYHLFSGHFSVDHFALYCKRQPQTPQVLPVLYLQLLHILNLLSYNVALTRSPNIKYMNTPLQNRNNLERNVILLYVIF